MEVQSGPEPEVVLQAIAQRPPRAADVHQLHTRLDDVGAGLLETRLDEAQQPEMDVVLGVEYADDVAAAFAQCGVERLGLFFGTLWSITTLTRLRWRAAAAPPTRSVSGSSWPPLQA